MTPVDIKKYTIQATEIDPIVHVRTCVDVDRGHTALGAGIQQAAARVRRANHPPHPGKEPVHLGDCLAAQMTEGASNAVTPFSGLLRDLDT